MTVESVTYISDLNPDAPSGQEPRGEGAEHMRATKTGLTNSFPFERFFFGYIDTAASAEVVPAGWSAAKDSTGRYTVTHNLGVGAADENQHIIASCEDTGSPSGGYWLNIESPGTNTFIIQVYDSSGVAQDPGTGVFFYVIIPSS